MGVESHQHPVLPKARRLGQPDAVPPQHVLCQGPGLAGAGSLACVALSGGQASLV